MAENQHWIENWSNISWKCFIECKYDD